PRCFVESPYRTPSMTTGVLQYVLTSFVAHIVSTIHAPSRSRGRKAITRSGELTMIVSLLTTGMVAPLLASNGNRHRMRPSSETPITWSSVTDTTCIGPSHVTRTGEAKH